MNSYLKHLCQDQDKQQGTVVIAVTEFGHYNSKAFVLGYSDFNTLSNTAIHGRLYTYVFSELKVRYLSICSFYSCIGLLPIRDGV